MIGLCTMIVKSVDGKYHAHRFGGYLHHMSWREQSQAKQYDSTSKAVVGWDAKGFDADNLDEEEVLKIAEASTDASEFDGKEGYRYHKLAGDGVYMLNHQTKTLKYFDARKGGWVSIEKNEATTPST